MPANFTFEILFKLLRLSFGREEELSLPEDVDWFELVNTVEIQGVPALAMDGLQRICEASPQGEGQKALERFDSAECEDARYEWFGYCMSAEQQNAMADRYCKELTDVFRDAGYGSCILKGQGMSVYYPVPDHRNPGDIDIWVDGGREELIAFARERWNVMDIVIHHAHVTAFPDVSVELHYLPAWLYNPWHNKRLQSFFRKEQSVQCASYLQERGFSAPTEKFNSVFLLVHLFRHFFSEGASLKQVADYYCILSSDGFTETDRAEAMKVISEIGLSRFCAGLMWVEQRVFGLEDSRLLFPADEKEGMRLLETVLSQRLAPVRMALRYGSEGVCILPWKIWHRLWRRRHGYI